MSAQSPEMALVLRLKAKSERRRRKWVSALRRAIGTHRPNPRRSALSLTGRKAATREDNYAETWRTKVLPSMRNGMDFSASRDLSAQEVLRRGIPNRLRGAVWPLAIGNSLRITGELFAIYRERGARQTQRFAIADEPSPRNVIGAERTITGISVDLPRTFPGLALFGKGSEPFHRKLRMVLEAATCYRPDMGYVQGMSFLAAQLCLYVNSPLECFVALMNLGKRASLIFLECVSTLLCCARSVDSNVLMLWSHFEELGMVDDVHHALYTWLQTSFFAGYLDLATRLFDGFVLLRSRTQPSSRFG